MNRPLQRTTASRTLLLVATFVAACSSGDDSPGGGNGAPDAMPAADARVFVDAAVFPTPDAGPDATVVTGDGNESFGDAVSISVGGTADDVLLDPEDKDYFQFEGNAGQWISVVTNANPSDDPAMIDTVIRVYDATMTMIAENDDALPRVNTDSEVILLLPTTGTYYVEVMEWTTWVGKDPEGGPSYTYEVAIDELTDALSGIEVEAELGDDAPSANSVIFSGGAATLLGTFEDDTDIDVYGLTVTQSGLRLLGTEIMPAGSEGYGSTSTAGRVWLTNAAGDTTIAEIDNASGPIELSPPVDGDANYLLWVEHPGGGLGSNDYYVLKVLDRNDNPEEAEDSSGDNDTLATGEALSMTTSGSTSSGFILARLDPTTTDVDYFTFPADSGDSITIACIGARAGSAVRDLLVDLRDPADASVNSTTEIMTEDAVVTTLLAPSTGTYALRLSAGDEEGGVQESFVRCGVHATTP